VSGLQFAAAIVNSLAWPAVALVATVLLRPELGGVLRRVQNFEIASVKAGFAALTSIEKMVAATARDAGVPDDETVTWPAETEFAVLDRLVTAAPGQAVIDAWTLLGYQLNIAANRLAPDSPHGWPQVTRALQGWDKWQFLAPAVDELRRLRDLTVRPGKPPSSADAARYVSVVRDIVATLQTITQADDGEGTAG
jgi:hypothetical protein